MLGGQSTVPAINDTIVALASPLGPGARAIVRLSGPSAMVILTELFGDPTIVSSPRRWIHGSIVLPGMAAPLPAEALVWPGPRSYTGQPVVELQTLSSPPLLQLLLGRCQVAGARPALPGEFTLRAFLAGKLDLTKVEAILAVVEADSRPSLKEALTQLAGGLSLPLQQLRDDLLNLLADCEAGLDFADEDIQFISETELLRRITKALAQITLIQKQLDERALGRRPFRVVLAGPPNAGKSCLFNALVGEQRALVSPAPGTTRDWIEAVVDCEGLAVQLVDTAGQGRAIDVVDRRAQELAVEQMTGADLVLWCIAPDAAAEPPMHTKLVRVQTKSDLSGAPGHGLRVSAHSGAGLDELRREVARQARHGSEATLGASLGRCRGHVDACLKHLRAAHRLVLEELPAELLAMELRLAIEELGAMVGAVYTDDLLDRIFSRFCIGK
ncbi:MAG: tRNA modification GTPase [Gemmataceae bacterium]|nr:tRNA modification GTPase [Gemmataceae bacterium]